MQCPKCGADILPKNKFCPECGHDLRSPAGQSRIDLVRQDIPKSLAQKILMTKDSISKERRDVTVLFVDISGFTSMSERLDPEELTLLMNECFRKLSIMVYRYEGIIDKFIGDCIMAIFGAPVAHEDDPERAILACTEMQHALNEVNKTLDKSLKKLNIHSGINTGQVIAGKVGSDFQMDYTVMGDTVNVAQRLKDLSPINSIYIGPETYYRTRHAFDCIALQPVQLKGKSTMITPYEVIGKKWGSEFGLSALHSDLVGRDPEIDRLKRSVESLVGNTSSINVIKGEIGVGKSRLLYEFKKYLAIAALDKALIDGRGVSYESANPLKAFSDCLHRFFVADATASDQTENIIKNKIKDILGDEAEEIAPYLYKLLNLPLGEKEKERIIHLDSHTLQLQIFLAITSLCEKLADSKGLILVVDDIQWLDATSIELLHFLLPIVKNHKAALFLSYRLGNIKPIKSLLDMIASEYISFLVEVNLKNLSPDDSAMLIDNLVGQHIATNVKEYIIQKSDGNPFFIEEIVRRISESKILESEKDLTEYDLQLPGSIEAAVTSRIDSLNKEAKYILKIASIIGRTFPQALLEMVIKDHDVYQHIDELETSEFCIKTIQEKKAYYAFRHALFQEVAYNSLLKSERLIYHRVIAEAIESAFKDEMDNFLSVLAHHYYKCENKEKALHYSIQAGNASATLYANEEALAFYAQALSIADNDSIEADILEKIADIKHLQGEFQTAAAHYGKAREKHTGILEKARLNVKYARVLVQKSQIDEAIAILKTTLASVKDTESAICANVIYSLARALLEFKLEVEEAERLINEGITLSKKIGDVGSEAFGLRMKAHFAWRTGQPEKGIEPVQQAMKIYEAQNDLKQLVEAYVLAGSVWRYSGKIDQAIEYTNKAFELCTKIGDKNTETRILNNLGVYNAIKGDFKTARAYYEKNLEERTKLGDVRSQGVVLFNLGLLYEHLGELDEAIKCYEKSRMLFEKINDVRNMVTIYPTLAYNLASKGDREQAAAYYEKAVALAETTQDKGALGSVYNYYGSFYYRIGDSDKALELYEKAKQLLLEAGDQMSLHELDLSFAEVYLDAKDPRAIPLIKAHLARARARKDATGEISGMKYLGKALALIEGKYDDGIKNIKHAIAAAESAGFTEKHADCLVILGEVLIANKKSDQARVHLAKAKKIYEKMHAPLQVQDVEKLLKDTESNSG
jgi:predicted ATPase/class 3 adenylate cyclase